MYHDFGHDAEVSWNRNTSKSSILMLCSIIKHPFWVPPFVVTSMFTSSKDIFNRLNISTSSLLLSLESTTVVAVAPLQRASKDTDFPASSSYGGTPMDDVHRYPHWRKAPFISIYIDSSWFILIYINVHWLMMIVLIYYMYYINIIYIYILVMMMMMMLLMKMMIIITIMIMMMTMTRMPKNKENPHASPSNDRAVKAWTKVFETRGTKHEWRVDMGRFEAFQCLHQCPSCFNHSQ